MYPLEARKKRLEYIEHLKSSKKSGKDTAPNDSKDSIC